MSESDKHLAAKNLAADQLTRVAPWVHPAFAQLQHLFFHWHRAQGFWPDTNPPVPQEDFNVGEKLMLIVTEVAEACEAHRKNLPDDKLPYRSGLEVELADALIRIFDLAGALNLDLAGALLEKAVYNLNRPFRHGKQY